MAEKPLRVGTRGSKLALIQTDEFCARLVAADTDYAHHGMLSVDIIKTTGDKITDRALADIGGKGLFAKEIDTAMLDGRIDVAVHSAKDLETQLPDGIVIGCVLPREDPRDALVSYTADSLEGLPAGALVGTASIRRQAQLLAKRPDVEVELLRGNVQTRLEKLKRGDVAATFLALAGLNRLGIATEIPARALDPVDMLPAAAQGAVAVTCRAGDTAALGALARLDDPAARLCVEAERAMLAALDGSCRTPIAALARLEGGALNLEGLIALPNGNGLWRDTLVGEPGEPVALGRELGERLIAAAGPTAIASLR